MNTYKRIGGDSSPYAYKYVNLVERHREKSNEELYEGWMRSDFSGGKVFERISDAVEVVRLTITA